MNKNEMESKEWTAKADEELDKATERDIRPSAILEELAITSGFSIDYG